MNPELIAWLQSTNGNLKRELGKSIKELPTFAEDIKNNDINKIEKRKKKIDNEGVITRSKTDIPDYDDLLKSGKVIIEEMSPIDYLYETEEIFGGNFRDSIDKRVCSKYVDDMYKGDVFPLLYLDYKKRNQEGRHRAFAAWILGIKKIPVLVIKKTLQEKLSRIFLESSNMIEENAHKDEINAINHLANELSLPMATKYIGSGLEATVFETTDPNVIVRYGSRDRILELENWADSGAVVNIIALQKVSGDEPFPYRGIISWNEKVDTNVSEYFYSRYKNNPEIAEKILSTLNSLGRDISEKDVEFLKQFDETEQFANAIEQGMPTNDLAVDSNLGINKNGQVVAYDL
jgi:hypothetical protein